jgi:hypothetical protein
VAGSPAEVVGALADKILASLLHLFCHQYGYGMVFNELIYPQLLDMKFLFAREGEEEDAKSR